MNKQDKNTLLITTVLWSDILYQTEWILPDHMKCGLVILEAPPDMIQCIRAQLFKANDIVC